MDDALVSAFDFLQQYQEAPDFEEANREYEAWRTGERRRALYAKIGADRSPRMTLEKYITSRWPDGKAAAEKLAKPGCTINAVFCGPTNAGKTHLLRGIARARIDSNQEGLTVEYLNEGHACNLWKSGFQDKYIDAELREFLGRCCRCKLLLWDELGRVFGGGDMQGAELKGISLLLEEVLDKRAESGLQTIFASMFASMEELQRKLGEAVLRRIMRQEADKTHCKIVRYGG